MESRRRRRFAPPKEPAPVPLERKNPTTASMHHAAYTFDNVDDLLERYVELRENGVQRFTPLLADAARCVRHSPGDRWFVDET
jgi:hypothetical protein